MKDLNPHRATLLHAFTAAEFKPQTHTQIRAHTHTQTLQPTKTRQAPNTNMSRAGNHPNHTQTRRGRHGQQLQSWHARSGGPHMGKGCGVASSKSLSEKDLTAIHQPARDGLSCLSLSCFVFLHNRIRKWAKHPVFTWVRNLRALP